MTIDQTALRGQLFRPFSADHRQLLSALPSRAVQDARRALEGHLSSEERIRLIADLEPLLARLEKNADHWLNELDPRVLFYSNRLREGAEATVEGNYLIGAAGINRFAWILGVGAKGTRQDVEALSRYFALCGQWMAVSSVLAAASTKDHDLPTGFRSNEWREQVKRIMPTEIRTAWACELICKSFATAVASSDRFAALRHVTTDSVRSLFEWLRMAKLAMDYQGSYNALSGRIVTPESTPSILSGVSTKSGSLSGEPFAALVFNPAIESGPIIEFGDEYLPIALRDAFTSLDLAFFGMARKTFMGREATKLRSDLFELTVRETVRQVAGDRFTVPSGEVLCTDPGSPGNEGETDFFFYDSQGFAYIGECKAMVAPTKAKTVLNAFKDQLAIAVDQVSMRQSRVQSGHDVTVSGVAISGLASSSVRGIVTPLHSYAAAILDRTCLAEIFPKEADLSRVSVIPLHQLTLLMAGIVTGRDLNEYFTFRAGLLERGVQIIDEMDTFISYIYAGPNTNYIVSQVPMDSPPFLAQYSMEVEAIYNSDRPVSPEAWVETLKKQCRSS